MTQTASRHAGTWRRHTDDGSRRLEPSRAHHTTRTPTTQELRAGATGKVCAAIVGDVLCKHVAASKHFLRTPRAIAFDTLMLDAAQRAKVTAIEVLDTETGTLYTATLGDFERFGLSLNRGFGPQRALPLDRWHVQRPGDAVQLQLL